MYNNIYISIFVIISIFLLFLLFSDFFLFFFQFIFHLILFSSFMLLYPTVMVSPFFIYTNQNTVQAFSRTHTV